MIDHDRLFKELITTFFIEFLELFLPDVRAFVEAESMEFLDKEIFVDVTAGERLEPDLVARVRFKDHPAFFIIHIETQNHPQKDFGRRLFRYFSRLYDKFNLPVYPIVVFSFRRPRTIQPKTYRLTFPNKLVFELHYDVIQLNRLNWREFIRRPNPVAAALMAKMNIAPEDRVRVKSECLRLLATLRLDKARMKLISGFIDSYLRLNASEQVEFEAEIKAFGPKNKGKVMEIVTSWMKEGIKQGRKEGAISTAQDDVVEILGVRFGRVPAVVTKALRKIDDVGRLKMLLREAATAATMKAFRHQLDASND
ncbi:MAG TPA: Rpn family recombination-promoting nuclease/putative transposase [Blastocatellia bacterium]